MGGDMLNAMKYISTVPFSGLFNWSVQYLNDSKIAFSKAYPMMRIGEFLKRNKTAVAIEDDKTYKRATIKVRNGGIFLRDEEIGSKIGTKNQFLISKGQFLLSKIDARNGAFGVVPEVLDGGIITGNFWTFDVDYNIINPHYLALLTTTEAFVQFCEQASNGTTNRHYLQEPLFLNIKVPVPSLEEQNKLVKEYNKTITKATQCDADINRISSDLSNKIKALLGYKDDSSDINNARILLTFCPLSKIGRWDWWNNAYEQISSLYPMEKLYKVIRMNSGLFLPKNKQIEGEYPVLGGNGVTGNHNAYCFSGKRIVIGRVGEYCGNIHIVDGKYWITDNAFKVDKISDIVSWEYLAIALEYMNLNQYRSISAQPSISQSKILNLSIPVPPPAEQITIVDYYMTNKKHLAVLEQKANEYRQNALKNFETQIFE